MRHLSGATWSLACLAALAMGTAGILGCQHETHEVSTAPEIRPDVPRTTLVGRASVYHDGRLVAVLKTFRFEETGERTMTRVLDLRENSLGYLTDDGRAFKHTAHGGTDLVANSTDIRRNVAAVIGMPTATLSIQQDG